MFRSGQILVAASRPIEWELDCVGFALRRKITKRRIALILLYRGFHKNEAKENQSDYVGSHSFGGRVNE